MSGSEAGALVLVAAVDNTGPIRKVVCRKLNGTVQDCPWLLRTGRLVSAHIVREHASSLEGRPVILCNAEGVVFSDDHQFGSEPCLPPVSYRDRARSRSR